MDITAYLPLKLLELHQIKEVNARKFGTEVNDLNINFGDDKISIITNILSNCCKGLDSTGLPIEFFNEMSISKRIEIIARLAIFSYHTSIELSLICNSEKCGEQIGFYYSNDFIDTIVGEDSQEIVKIPVNNDELILTKPTGSDQLTLKQLKDLDILEIVRILSPNYSQFSVDDIKANIGIINQTMKKFDKLIKLELRIKCSFCGQINNSFFNIQEKSLSILQRIQEAMISEVITISKSLGWSESEIFKLPSWRRRFYLDKLVVATK